MRGMPRLEIDLDKIRHNARFLVQRLGGRGISVTGVCKAAAGSADLASVLLSAGVRALGDSRIENIEAMQCAGVQGPMMLLRSPMLSQLDRVVACVDVSCNTELAVISGLSAAVDRQAAVSRHAVVLMVELGDLREGILPGDLAHFVEQTLRFPGIELRGIGTNLACCNGVSPDAGKMTELSVLADSIEAAFDLRLEIVSGGNSANLDWALGAADTGRINDLRLGEAILLGRETLHRQPIDGLYTDAFKLVAEVIESKVKPSLPWGVIAETAFGERVPAIDRGCGLRAILALGRQDTDPEGLCSSSGFEILGASSDHLVLDVGGGHLPVGAHVSFAVDYSALVRAMISPYVAKIFSGERPMVGATLGPWLADVAEGAAQLGLSSSGSV